MTTKNRYFFPADSVPVGKDFLRSRRVSCKGVFNIDNSKAEGLGIPFLERL
jgi:hypothetical protein